jgi:hypothetical protein
MTRDISFWVAQASRVSAIRTDSSRGEPANASRIRELFMNNATELIDIQTKDCFGATPKSARETSALPGD